MQVNDRKPAATSPVLYGSTRNRSGDPWCIKLERYVLGHPGGLPMLV